MTATIETYDDVAPVRALPARRLLVAGIVSGPLFLASALTQAFTRDGFDLRENALSQLATGDLWFLQVATFLTTGALLVAAAVGLHRTGAGAWVPRLVGLWGAGLVIAGLFPVDPSFGYPAGAPAGAVSFSWHGMLHSVAFFVAMAGFVLAAAVSAVRFARGGRTGWALLFALAPVAVVLVFVLPGLGTLPVRMAAGCVPQFALVAALCGKVLRETSR